MHASIKLRMKRGSLPEKEFVFGCRTVCTVGRAEDCFLRLPSEGESLTVSRRHCLFDINPPEVRVRDLGSRNGT
jgi:pSer/pThr/pTyr-binding forkhead associated (FHA) protein